MLVLTRKLNESIILDGNIRVMVVEIRKNQVRLGIEAPRDVKILRDELSSIAGEANHASKHPRRSNVVAKQVAEAIR
jgi:carbon storage regulator